MMRKPYETPVITTLEANEILDSLGPAQSLSSGGGGGGGSGSGGPSSVIGGGGGSNTFGG
jgi:hypothetical protein